MTLCIAWKNNNQIHFASDSRMTLAPNSRVDVGIKVLSVPVKIYSPSDEHGNKTLEFEYSYGMCFAGSTVNSYLIKESITEVLQHLQYAPRYTDVSMDSICKLIFKVYKQISTEICSSSLAERGISNLIIGGYCPKKEIIRAFQFSTTIDNIHSCNEILIDNGRYWVTGSGSKYAETILSDTPPPLSNTRYLEILKKVIDSDAIEDVGGNIQYGKFEGQDFKVYGIVEYDQVRKAHYYSRGLDLNSPEFQEGYNDFIISYQYIDPFNTFGR